MNEKFLVFGRINTRAYREESDRDRRWTDDGSQQVLVLDTSNGSLIALEKTEMKTRKRKRISEVNFNTLMMEAFVCGENGISRIEPEMESQRIIHDEENFEYEVY